MQSSLSTSLLLLLLLRLRLYSKEEEEEDRIIPICKRRRKRRKRRRTRNQVNSFLLVLTMITTVCFIRVAKTNRILYVPKQRHTTTTSSSTKKTLAPTTTTTTTTFFFAQAWSVPVVPTTTNHHHPWRTTTTATISSLSSFHTWSQRRQRIISPPNEILLSSSSSLLLKRHIYTSSRFPPFVLSATSQTTIPTPTTSSSISHHNHTATITTTTTTTTTTSSSSTIQKDDTTATETTTTTSQQQPQQQQQQSLLLVYQELIAISTDIRNHDELYYEQSQPVLTDEEYDALCQREADICQAYPQLLSQWQKESGLGTEATRYGGRVGIRSSSSSSSSSSSQQDDKKNNNDSTTLDMTMVVKQKHLRPMLSLDNVHNTDQLWTWLERIYKRFAVVDQQQSSSSSSSSILTIVTEPKLDGLSLSLRYTNNNDLQQTRSSNNNHHQYTLQWACTRGDGKQGKDVTAAIRQGLDVPTTFTIPNKGGGDDDNNNDNTNLPSVLEVRGEVVLPLSAFQELKREYKLQQQQQQQTAEEELSIHKAANHTDDNSSNITSGFEENPKSNNNHASIPFFSNARNAASGILLRKQQQQPKESDDNKTQSSSSNNNNSNNEVLLSKLRFYAYDLVVSSDHNNNDNYFSPLHDNYLEIRSLLEAAGFSVPEPFATTTLTITTPNTDHSSNDTENVMPWNDTTIGNMLQYHDELKQHREQYQATFFSNQDNDDDDNTSKSSRSFQKQLVSKWGDFEMDGCVHKIAELDVRQMLGTSNRAPRWAVAHKFPPLAAVTTLNGVEIQVGRTGVLTPVAILEPVDLAGVTVQRATLHNFVQMQKVLLGDDATTTTTTMARDQESGISKRIPVGSSVIVRRAGDVIPQVVSRVGQPSNIKQQQQLSLNETDFISLEIPSSCPACGSALVFDTPVKKTTKKKTNATQNETVVEDTPVTEYRVIRCGGPALLCPPRSIGALQHAFARDALDINGLSEARIKQLMDNDLLKMPCDLFELARDSDQLAKVADLDGWGPKSAQNLASAANRIAKEGVALSRFIHSLGIRLVGIHSSSLLAAVYGTVDEFLRDIEEAAKYDLNTEKESDEMEIFRRLREENDFTKGIGPALISSLYDFSQQKELVDAARALAKSIVVMDGESKSDVQIVPKEALPFADLSVVFTGSLPNGVTRAEAQKLAKELGAKSTPGSLSKSTGLLVVGSKGEASKKMEKANSFGVKVIDADEFLGIVENYRSRINDKTS